MTMLEQVGEGLWTHAAPMKFPGGIHGGTRTTLARLADGSLWVHSPCRMSDELAREVDALGPVSHLVAPNLYHHLFMNQWARRYPNAKAHVAPGLEKKRADIAGAKVLGDAPDAAWASVIDQVWVKGYPRVNEVIFLHRSSRSLIVTDLIMCVNHADNFQSQLFWKLSGVLGKPGRSFVGKVMLRNPSYARVSMDRVLAWDFDRILLAHRDVVATGGRRVLEEAFASVR